MQSRKRYYAALVLISGLAMSGGSVWAQSEEDERITPENAGIDIAVPVERTDGPAGASTTRRPAQRTPDRLQVDTPDRLQVDGSVPDPFAEQPTYPQQDQVQQRDQTRPQPQPKTTPPPKRKVEPDPMVLNPDRQQTDTDRIQTDTDRIQTDTPVGKPGAIDDPFGDLNQTAPVRKGKGNPDADQSGPIRPVIVRHGPPGRGGDCSKWETVDGSNQNGTKEAREALGKEIYCTGVGFSGQDLANATRSELVDILMWLDDAEKREKGYKENLDRSAQKLDRQKKNLATMSLGDLYKVRVGGWFDHQKDEDDMRVSMDFKRFLQDRANRSERDPRSIYGGLLQDMDHLIMIAGPAYRVPISPTEIRSVRTVEDKFREGDHKGVFQFSATYVMGLLLDRGNLKEAIAAKGYAQRPPRDPYGKGKANPDSDQYMPQPPVLDPWGKGGNRPDVDSGAGNYGKGPRSPGGNGNGNGGIDPGTRQTMRTLANAGTQILQANDNHDRQMKAINDEYLARQNAMNGNPAAPGGNDQGLARALSDSDQMLDQIRERQRQVVDLVTQWRQARDPNSQRAIEANIRGIVYGQDSRQPAPDSIMGMLSSPQLKNALGFANSAGQSQNPAFQSAAGRIFGAGGKLDRVQRTQHEVIAQFLKDRDTDSQRQKEQAMTGPNRYNPNDPNNPNNYGPNGEPPLNPNGAQQLGPNGQPLGPNGQPLSPSNQPIVNNAGGPNAPTTQTPVRPPQQVATDPTQRLGQIATALQDPNLTPAERTNLLGEQTRIQNQLAAQQKAAAAAAAPPVAGPAAPTAAVNPAGAADRAKAKMPNVPNTYGVSPTVLSDGELQAAANGAIQAHLAAMNKELSAKGMTVNEFLQYSGKGVTSTGRPSGDHYAMWCQRFPDVKDAMVKAAQDAYNKKLQDLTNQEMAATPAPAPAATPAAVPVATPVLLPSQIGSGPAGAIVEPR